MNCRARTLFRYMLPAGVCAKEYAANNSIHVVNTKGAVEPGTCQVFTTLAKASVKMVETAAPITIETHIPRLWIRNVGRAAPTSTPLNPYRPCRRESPSTLKSKAVSDETATPSSAPHPMLIFPFA